MSEINKAIEYDAEQQALIDLKIAEIGKTFDYKNWSDDDLQKLRSSIRNFYRDEQKGLCAYCKNIVSTQSASNCHVEHIVSKSKNLSFIFEPKNLCVICADCNEIKRDKEVSDKAPDTLTLSNGKTRQKYPKTSTGFKIFHPHFDIYKEHILIYNGFYVDKTKKGHFTIGICNLNRRLHRFGYPDLMYNEAELFSLMKDFLETIPTKERKGFLKKLKKIAGQIS